MRKMSKKIIVSVLTLVLTVVALGTTTYAWFTVGGTVNVEQFEMDVTSGIGLEVAYMPTGTNNPATAQLNYVKTISEKSLLSHLYIDYVHEGDLNMIELIAESDYDSLWKSYFRMDAFTTINGREMQSLVEGLDPDTEYKTVTLVNAAKTSGYVEFKLAFRTKHDLDGSDPIPLILNQIGLKSDGVNFVTPTQYTTTLNDTHNPADPAIEYKAENSTRISFAEEATGGLTKVYEKAESTSNSYLGQDGFIWDKGAHDFYRNQQNIDLELFFGASGSYSPNHKVVETTKIADLDEDVIANFPVKSAPDAAFRYAVVTIRIWLEGFDADTFNAIFDDKLFFRFGFNIEIE